MTQQFPFWNSTSIYPKTSKTLIWKDIYTSLRSSQHYLQSKIWKQPKWYIYNGILLGHKKECNLTICNNMGGPRGYSAEWIKSDRERQIPYNFTYMWNLKHKISEQIKQKLIDTENKLIIIRWGIGRLGKKRWRATHTRWLSWLEYRLCTKGLQVWFPARAHDWVMSLIPSQGTCRGSWLMLFT